MFPLSLFLALALDLLSKFYVQLYYVERYDILGDYLYFEYLRNPGIAFSLPVHWLLLKVVTIFLILFISYYYVYHEKKNVYTNIWYGLLLWWALWNAYERIIYGSVTDFIWVKYFSVFNFADVCICVWVFILWVFSYVTGSSQSKRNKS